MVRAGGSYSDACFQRLYTSLAGKRSKGAKASDQVNRLATERFSANQHPRQPITTLQAPSVNRLHRHPSLLLRDHDSQKALTLGAGALEVFGSASIESHSAAGCEGLNCRAVKNHDFAFGINRLTAKIAVSGHVTTYDFPDSRSNHSAPVEVTPATVPPPTWTSGSLPSSLCSKNSYASITNMLLPLRTRHDANRRREERRKLYRYRWQGSWRPPTHPRGYLDFL